MQGGVPPMSVPPSSPALSGIPTSTLKEAHAPWTESSHPTAWQHLRAVLDLPGLLWRTRDLVVTCLMRDLTTRFRGTALGWLWPLVQPALLFVVYGFLFTRILGLRMPGASEHLGASYGLYLFTGALVWSGFAESVTRATTSLVEGRHLITKLTFPSELLPLTPVLGGAVTMLLGSVVTLGVTTLTGVHRAPGWELVWLPVLLLLGVSFTYGLALMFSAVHVHLRDTREFLACGLTVLMFATPVFWVPSIEVLPAIGPYLKWVQASPLYLWMSAWRSLLMGGQPEAVFALSLSQSCLALVPWSFGSLVCGRIVFTSLQRGFADEV